LKEESPRSVTYSQNVSGSVQRGSPRVRSR